MKRLLHRHPVTTALLVLFALGELIVFLIGGGVTT